MALAGNKLDANNKQVNMSDGQGFARKHDIKIVSEVSAMSGENVDNLIQQLSLACYNNRAKFVSIHISYINKFIRIAISHEGNFQVGTKRCKHRRNRRQKEEERMLQVKLILPSF